MQTTEEDVKLAKELHKVYEELTNEIGKVIVGQKEVVRLLATSIFCGGHALLVGVPGLAKTLVVQTLAKTLGLDFSRIQFTPDLMPSDVLGAETLDQERNFRFKKGPIFSNVILADEINRTPPKTQAALLEAMQEGAVTTAGSTHQLDKPFFVLATQNPIEQEGTYPLPEAQLDRFIFMIELSYPSYEDELSIIKQTTRNDSIEVRQVLDKEKIISFQSLIRKVPIADNVVEYAVKLVHNTRPYTEKTSEIANQYLDWGAGPRAGQYLVLAAKCNALINNRLTPDIQDVKDVAVPVLSHRIIRNFKADAERLSVRDLILKLL